jgi:hypothetical protein
MRRRTLILGLVVGMAVLMAAPPSALAATNNRVTLDNDGVTSYTRYDGLSDATTTACSSGRRAQNEPTVAVDPNNTAVVIAGSNDYCAAMVNGDVWAGYYRSTDGGTTWHDSLVPGYPADDSAAGTASPVHGSCTAAGDPTQSFDNAGRLFYGFICFNRGKPVNGGLYVSRYLHDGADYDRTVLVKKGTPSALFAASGHFQDKVNITVDQSPASPHEGNVYVGWSQYNGRSGNNDILLARSTNHGASFDTAIKVTPVEHGTGSFVDLGVGPDGTLYATWLTYTSADTANVRLARSTNGGASFRPAVVLASITLFDSGQFSGNGSVDCGDAPFDCPTGFTYSRFTSDSAVTADAAGVHVVWASRNPAGQSKVWVRNSADGVHFPSPPVALDSVAVGHQWMPDIASADGTITVVFYDSRDDPSYSPAIPPGDTASGSNSGNVVNTFVARSADGGTTWSESQVTNQGSNFGWETHGSRLIGFWGDYIYVSAVPGAVNVAWTDSRDLVSGSDPRENGDNDFDGFDVFQPCSSGSPAVDDPCLSQGGLDQNVYGSRI